MNETTTTTVLGMGVALNRPSQDSVVHRFVPSIVLVLVLSAAVLVLVLEMSDLRFRDRVQAGTACHCFAIQ